jgi:hypothetical protein
MSVLDFYNETRKKYPAVTLIADIEHIRIWDEIDPEFAYSWFESLAKALNKEMCRNVETNKHKNLIEFISSQYQIGDAEVKNCIDVSFIENLFWEVPTEKADPYWKLLPENLKELYVDFYGRTPL